MSAVFYNPINQGPDPWMIYFQGNYYLTTSQGNCIRMWKAPKISELATTPPTIVWADADPSRNQQMWAGEFHRINERWYMYYTASDGIDRHHHIYVLESVGDDPIGPYTFKAQIGDFWAIDPGLLQLDDGRLFFLWTGSTNNSNALFIAQMENPWTICEPHVLIAEPTLEWERHGFPVNEAPEILQRHGKVFLIYSACDTGTPDYCLGMLTADADADFLNPAVWRKAPQSAFQRSDADGVFAPGHNGFFKSPDGTEDWIVYHARTSPEYTYSGRITRAQPFTWNEDGTPNFGLPISLTSPVKVPSGE